MIILIVIFNSHLLSHQKVERNLVNNTFYFISISILASIIGVNFSQSIWGNYFRNDGLLTYLHLLALFLIIIAVWQKNWWKPMAISLVSGSTIASLWTLYYGLNIYVFGNISVPNWNKAIGISFGQPNFLAGYLLVTLPFTVYFLQQAKKIKFKILFWSLLISQLLAIILTLARASIVITFIYVAIYFNFKIIKKIINKLISVVRISQIIYILIPLSISLITFFVVIGFHYYQVSKIFSPDFPESRIRIISQGLLAFWEKPILGWGWANFDKAFAAVVWLAKFRFDVYVDKAHSHLLEILTTTGILGFISYLVLLNRAIRILVRKIHNSTASKSVYQTLLFSLILFLVHSQTNVISISEEIIFWLILGITAVG